MSYHADLDEVPEDKLRAELERRSQARELGLCDYCGREGDETPCKFPERHRVAAELLTRQRRRQGVYAALKNHSLALQAGIAELPSWQSPRLP